MKSWKGFAILASFVPWSEELYDLAVLVQVRLRRYDEAAETYKKGLELAPQDTNTEKDRKG